MITTSIILAITEGADYLRASAEAVISAYMDCGEDAELIVVTPTAYLSKAEEALRHIDDIQICPVETNSLAQLNNYGRAFASGSRVLFVREGILLHAEGLRMLLDTIDRSADIGAVGSFSNRTVFEWQYINAEHLEADGITPSTELAQSVPEPTDSLFLENFALLVRTEAFDRVGGFCADFPESGGEDIDLSFRLKCMGYRLMRVPVYLRHVTADLYRIYDMRRAYARPILLNKWGLDIGLPESLWHKALMAIDWQQNPALIHATCRSVLLRAPLVSIFIMTYNRPEYFREALESALAQTYPNIEIIVGDFGTDDRTQQLVQEYLADHRIRYVRAPVSPRKEHHKMFHPLAQGDFIQWLMDDDILLPDRLTLMVDAFLRYPNVTLVTSQRGVIDAEGKFMGQWNAPMPLYGAYEVFHGADIGKKLLIEHSNFIGEPSIVLYKNEDHVPIVETVVACGYDALADVAMWLHFLLQGDCVIFARALGLLRRHTHQEGQKPENYISGVIEWKSLMDEYRGSVFLTEEGYHMCEQGIKEMCSRLEPVSQMVDPSLRQAFLNCYRSVLK